MIGLMSLEVHTARLGFRGEDWLDVSLQGNMRRADSGESGGHRGIGLYFAPSPELLFPYLSKRKFGRLTEDDWAAYFVLYTREMRASYRQYRGAWETLLLWPRVVLLCFCTDHEKCHRTVLSGILARLGAVECGEIETTRRAS